MGAWRGHPNVKPGARMAAAVRRMRAHRPQRGASPVAAGPTRIPAGTEPIAVAPPAPTGSPRLSSWTRHGVGYPNPRMTKRLAPRLLHP